MEGVVTGTAMPNGTRDMFGVSVETWSDANGHTTEDRMAFVIKVSNQYEGIMMEFLDYANLCRDRNLQLARITKVGDTA